MPDEVEPELVDVPELEPPELELAAASDVKPVPLLLPALPVSVELPQETAAPVAADTSAKSLVRVI